MAVVWSAGSLEKEVAVEGRVEPYLYNRPDSNVASDESWSPPGGSSLEPMSSIHKSTTKAEESQANIECDSIREELLRVQACQCESIAVRSIQKYLKENSLAKLLRLSLDQTESSEEN